MLPDSVHEAARRPHQRSLPRSVSETSGYLTVHLAPFQARTCFWPERQSAAGADRPQFLRVLQLTPDKMPEETNQQAKQSQTTAADVPVTAGTATTNINAGLTEGGTIRGTVTHQGQPVGGECVTAAPSTRCPIPCAANDGICSRQEPCCCWRVGVRHDGPGPWGKRGGDRCHLQTHRYPSRLTGKNGRCLSGHTGAKKLSGHR